MNEENQGKNQHSFREQRRLSEHGIIKKANDSARNNRRQSLSGAIHVGEAAATAADRKETAQPRVSFAPDTADTSPTTNAPAGAASTANNKTPSKKRVNLGSASSYYFKNTPKTPLQKVVSEQRKLNSSMQSMKDESFALDDLEHDKDLTSTSNVTINAAELSFLSLGAASTPSSNSSSSNNSSGIDLLNQSTLSDTTELTASNYIFATTSRQRLSEVSLLAHAADHHKEEKEQQQSDKVDNDADPKEREKDDVPMSEAQVSIAKETTATPAAEVNTMSRAPRPPFAKADRRMSLPVPTKQTDTTEASNHGQERRRESWQPGSSTSTEPMKTRDDAVEPPTTLTTIAVAKETASSKSVNDDVTLPPLISKITSSGNRRLSLPVLAKQTSNSDHRTDGKNRRESWQPGSSSETTTMNVEKFRKISAEMKNRRLEREYQRQQDEKRRLSVSSQQPKPSEQCATDSTSAESPFPAFSPLKSSETKQTTSNDNANESDMDVSKRSLDALFNSITKPDQSADTSMSAVSDSLHTSDMKMDVLVAPTDNSPLSGPTASASTPGNQTKASSSSETAGIDSTDAVGMHGISPASSFTTAASLGNLSKPSDIVSHSPRPLPDAIAFASREDLRADTSSPFRTDPPSAEKKKLTPTKLKKSPRRLPNPDSIHSPARNTRSQSKQQLEGGSTESSPPNDDEKMPEDLYENVSSPSLSEPPSSPKNRKKTTPRSIKLRKTPRRALNPDLEDSPARNTRAQLPFNNDETEDLTEEIAVARKRRRDSDFTGTVNLSQEDAAVPNSRRHSNMSTGSILNSSFRKAGSVRREGRLQVNFGSPEVAEFNKDSPSMSLTPMPAKKLRATEVQNLPEDTVEIEADMNALLNGIAPPTSLQTSPLKEMNEEDEMEVAKTDETTTVELEDNVEQVLNATEESAVDMSMESTTASIGAERTVELEVNMQDLLHHGAETTDILPQTSQLVESMDLYVEEEKKDEEVPPAEEDRTVELELNMADLLSGVEDKDASQALLSMSASPSTIRKRRRRSSISSRRFSLAPETRLSLSTDGEVFDPSDAMEEEEEYSSPGAKNEMDASKAKTSEQEEPVELNLKRFDLIKKSKVKIDGDRPATDLLVHITQALGEVDLLDTANSVLEQIIEEVSGTTEPDIELNQVVSASEESIDNMLKLQSMLEQGDEDYLEEEFSTLVAAIRGVEENKWLKWLTSVANSIMAPLEEKRREYENAITEIASKTMSVQDTHNALTSLASKAVQRAQRKSFLERKVCLNYFFQTYTIDTISYILPFFCSRQASKASKRKLLLWKPNLDDPRGILQPRLLNTRL